jgi:hypothetical protein
MGQGQSGGPFRGAPGRPGDGKEGEKKDKDGKDKKKPAGPPRPATQTNRRKKKRGGPEAAAKLPEGKLFCTFLKLILQS